VKTGRGNCPDAQPRLEIIRVRRRGRNFLRREARAARPRREIAHTRYFLRLRCRVAFADDASGYGGPPTGDN